MKSRLFRTAPALLLLLLCVAPAAADTADPRELMDSLRAGTLDIGSAVEVSSMSIDMGLGTIEISSGWLIPANPIDGRVMEVVFVGDARVEMEAPNRVEAKQLRLFTDQESLDVPIESAVLVIGDEDLVATLLERDTGTPAEDVLADAGESYDGWVAGPLRRGFGADTAMLRSILGDAPYRRYFAARFDSETHGQFQYIFDPAEQEQISLGQFVPIDLDDRQKEKVQKRIRRQRRDGRSLQTRLDDLGNWDTWLQAKALDAGGRPAAGTSGFESKRYTMEITLDPKHETLGGTVTIDAVVEGGGRRMATLTLNSDLEVSAVRLGDGQDLPWLRSKSDLHVVLPEGLVAGAEFQLQIDYSGVMFYELEPGVFPLQDTYSWYPHLGTVDRATYRTTFHYPKKFTLLSSGRTVADTTASGTRSETKELDVPVFGFTFEVGDFEVREEQVGHVTLTVGIAKTTLAMDSGARQDVVDTLKDALAYYEVTFGRYPLDYLTVATVPRGFSQGFLSCVTLSHFLLANPGRGWTVVVNDGRDVRQDSRIETVAHELAHQWWGNMVGWESYRDQWLSEALADYSAIGYTASRTTSSPIYLAAHAREWKSKLRRGAGKGRTVESLGPVVLGRRLNSSLSGSAYSSIVYDKGSIVFGMLARMLGPEPFNRMLRALAESVANRVISTETFVKAIEHMSGTSLESFADQYIYGTGIPEIYYRFDFEQDDSGKWLVSGEARQVAGANYRYTYRRTEAGGWDVARKRLKSSNYSDRAFVAPFQILVADPDASAPKDRKTRWQFYQSGRGLGGNIVIRGDRSEFSVEVAEEPVDFFIDQSGEVLAHFYCETREPKRMLRYRAMELEGKEAEEMFLKALRVELYPERIRSGMKASAKELQQRSDYEDALIYLRLSRIYLDQGRDADAVAALEQGEALFRGRYRNYSESTRDALKSRIEIRRGDYRHAWDRLSRSLYMLFPRTGEGTIGSEMRRNKWRTGSRRYGNGEDYAMLALVAAEQDHPLVARQAVKEAEERGADVSLLREAYPEMLSAAE